MRTLVLILMIALLPMRMWAAEGMAVRMASAEALAATDVSAIASMPEDCPMMAQAASGEEAPQTATHCTACHLCAASACLRQVAFEQGPAPTGPPVARQPAYASVDLARDLRPPIS